MINPSQNIIQNSPSNKTKKNINQSHSNRPSITSSSYTNTFGNRNHNHNHANSNNELLCNNCGKHGHLFYICKIPITSIGVIAYRKYNNENQYLMIRRKDTLGYIDFLRGKFSLDQKQYIMNMILQMTNREKEILMQKYLQCEKAIL